MGVGVGMEGLGRSREDRGGKGQGDRVGWGAGVLGEEVG